MLEFNQNMQNTCNNMEEVSVAPGACCCCSCCCCVAIGVNNGTASTSASLTPTK
ncbi:streptolysin S family TOMM toxin [Clostridium gasigenes]|uniref:streptolysin S family TOMM toxin n=1 Tax=Clostridium gasigenes TaxID=94869 RepID=UPI001C0B2399|nr:streptolysin S family TOMM toxin [Clostridium gasigenes]MBU3090027.1 streptolysin S family TOMM toxin [Clostridium gasigenes]MBU3136209.1 streptolysin S family TOMM toxin [Clostridium gasigenes]